MSGELELISVPGGTRLRLRVRPGAHASSLRGAHGGALKLAVAAAPEKGKANRAVIELLSLALNLPRSAVTIVSGESSEDKVVEIALDAGSVRDILEKLDLPTKS